MESEQTRKLLKELEEGINNKEIDKALSSIEQLLNLKDKLFVSIKNLKADSEDYQTSMKYLELEKKIQADQLAKSKEAEDKTKKEIVEALKIVGADQELAEEIARDSESIKEARKKYRSLVKGEIPLKANYKFINKYV